MGARCCCWFSNQQPCSAWEPLLFFFPFHFPLHGGDTSTSVGCVVSWWENYLLENPNPIKDFFHLKLFPGLAHEAAVQKTVSLQGRERMRYRYVMGKGLLLFTLVLDHAGLLCLFTALCPVKSSPDQNWLFLKNLTSSSKNSAFKQYFVTQNSQLRLPRNSKTTSKLYCNRSNIIMCWV